MLKTRRSRGRLIFNMGIPILVSLYREGPWSDCNDVWFSLWSQAERSLVFTSQFKSDFKDEVLFDLINKVLQLGRQCANHISNVHQIWYHTLISTKGTGNKMFPLQWCRQLHQYDVLAMKYLSMISDVSHLKTSVTHLQLYPDLNIGCYLCEDRKWLKCISFDCTAYMDLGVWETLLTHRGRNKMEAISQMIFWSTFSWLEMFEFRLKFHWSVLLRVQLTIFQHWFR